MTFNPSDLGWGGFMMLAGMGTVFLLLGLLMAILLLIGVFDKRAIESARRKEALAAAAAPAPAVEAAPVAAEPVVEEVVDPGMVIMHDGLTRDQIAAISLAVTIHARVRRAQAAPAMRIYQPGSHLYASRWVTAGRSNQNSSWRRK